MGDGLQVTASTEEVGRAALAAGIVLTDLRAGGAGLEDLFLELTSATARDGAGAVPPPPPPSHGAHVPNIASMPPVDSPLTPPGGHHR